MDILKIGESELCDLIIEKHKKAYESNKEESVLLQHFSILYEKHDQVKYLIQKYEEEGEKKEKINKYMRDEKEISMELSRALETLKSKFKYEENSNLQQRGTILNQVIEEHEKALKYWKQRKETIGCDVNE